MPEKKITKAIVCPMCGEMSKADVYTSINPSVTKGVRRRALDGELFAWKCPSCGYSARLTYPILYNDMKSRFMVYFIPKIDHFQLCDNELEEKYSNLRNISKRIVPTFNSFKEKIFIFESGLDDMSVELTKLAISQTVSKKLNGAEIHDGYLSMYDRERNTMGFTYFTGEKHTPYVQTARLEIYVKSKKIVDSLAYKDKKLKGFLKIDREWAENILYQHSTIFDFRHANITLFVYTKSKISYLCKDETQLNMKILWIDLNSSYAHSSLALPALHAQIAKNNSVKWEIVSATINENVGMIVDEIYRHQPDIIAATTWLFNHEQLLHITARLKALLPNSCFILGGPEFLGNNEDFLHKNPFIDCVFRGEGEEAFPQWLSCWNQPEKWDSIPGLCYMNPQKQYIDNGIARVLNFSRLVPPENSSFFNWSKPFVQLETTRGCFNTCAFCVSGEEKPVRTLSIESIRERLQIIHSHGIKNVRVLDRTFNYNPRRAKELLQLFLEFNPDICFHLEIHPALLSEELKNELKKLPKGLLHLEAGIQSLREPVLQKSRRMGSLEDSLQGLRFLCSLPNMETHADLIAGLPLYRLSEIFEDVRTLAGYNAGEIQLESLKLLPGTEMRRRAEELGIRYSPLPPYEVLQTNEISVNELQTARQLSRLLDGFYNTTAWQAITRKLILDDNDFLRRFLEFLIDKNLIDQPMSLEKRGLVLYEFCSMHYPAYKIMVTIAWIEAGMSLKKKPAEKVKTKRQMPPEYWEVIYGNYKESLRLCFLPIDDNTQNGYWFGFESEIQKAEPVFKAKGIMERYQNTQSPQINTDKSS